MHRANDWSVVKQQHEKVAEGDEEAEERATQAEMRSHTSPHTSPYLPISPTTQAEMRFQMLMQQMGRISVLATTARLLMLWAPPILYVFIFLPCW